MKKFLLLIIIFIATTVIYSEVPQIDQELLLSSKWCPDTGSFGWWLSFKNDSTYKIKYAGESGGEHTTGTYSIINNNVVLKKTFDFQMPESSPLSESVTTWHLEIENESYLFQYKLISDNGYSFWMKNSNVPDGEIRSVDGVEIILEKIEKCELLFNSKVRKGPGLDYDSSTFALESFDSSMPYLPEGYYVNIIGRTRNMINIEEWNDYWYYCELNIGWYDVGPSHGWIYGALLNK